MNSSMTPTVRSGLGPHLVQTVVAPLLAPGTDRKHTSPKYHSVQINREGKLS